MKGFFHVLAAVLLLTIGIQAVSLPAASAAQEGFNILTSPLPIKLTTAPGKTVSAELRLKNQSNSNETIKVGLMRFGAQGDLGRPNLFDLTPKDTYANWVHFSPSQFVAEPGVWKTVKMTIDVPSDASLGYYMAVTFGRAAQAGQADATNVKGAAATLVLLDVHTGNEVRKLQLVDFSSQHKLYEYLPASFNIRVRNSGNIYLAPTGNIFIQRGSKPVSTIVFNEAGGSVLPSSNRQFSVAWKSGFPLFTDKVVNGKPVLDKKGNPVQELRWKFSDADKFRFGHYTAKLLLVYDNGQNDVPLESELSFWVLPWKILLVLFVIFLVVAYGIWTLSRSLLGKAKSGARKIRRRD
ncbi:MAG: exported protein of unknown function [Candidatus Saccharibacteria bacterium]|nr:exported protein of unknown function [Candidatus Saccharibacteria bacterium]